jgi:hypothetical protein
MFGAGEKGAVRSDMTHHVVEGGDVLDIALSGSDFLVGEGGAKINGVVEPDAVGESRNDGGEGVHSEKI